MSTENIPTNTPAEDVLTNTPAAQDTEKKDPKVKKEKKEKEWTLTDQVSETEFCYNLVKAFPKDRVSLFDTKYFAEAMGAKSENQFKKHLQRLAIKDSDFQNIKPTMSTTNREEGAVIIRDLKGNPQLPPAKDRPKPRPGLTPPTPTRTTKRKRKEGDTAVSKKVCRHVIGVSCANCPNSDDV